MQLKVLLQTTRPSFLVLTPICVFLGISTSILNQSPINYFLVYLILLGATFAHISVNTLNEYFDFKSGLDLKTNKTPFSGGSGALPGHPDMAKSVLVIGLVSLMVTIATGSYLVLMRGTEIIPIGLVGIILIVTYTQWINRSPLLCLIAPGLGFGILMVVGTHVILTGEYTSLSRLLALVPFFLINNLLLLNQYPDIDADSSVGRKTFPIVFGVQKSNLVYAFFMLAAYSLILFLIIMGYLPTLSTIALIPMILSIFALTGMMRFKFKIGDYPIYMGANVAATILAPLLLGLSIIKG